MPDDNSFEVKTNAEVEIPSPDDVQDALCRLEIHDDQEQGGAAKAGPYPDRPGEPDCLYYLRNGSCKYGINCRYNHPPYDAQATQFVEDLPEREGQPDCGYYLKTGTCKYGPTCKYHHPKDRNGAGPVLFNTIGLPMRQDEKPCPHYMRYGSCKFGAACKFHHPQPASLKTGQPLNGQSALGSAGSSIMLSGVPYVGGVPTWSLSRATYISDPRMQGSHAYLPVVMPSSQDMIVTSGWNTYVGSLSPALSSCFLANGALYNSTNQGDAGFGAQPNLFPASSGILPERPDQPECRYFMNNGTCKYGSDCKYHHPKERMPQLVTSLVGPNGLPSRPVQPICPNYTVYGVCKFGSACRFDHPFVYSYGYNPSLPFPATFDSSLFTYPRMPQNRMPSETLLSPPYKFYARVQKPDYAGGKHLNLDIATRNPVDSLEPADSPKPPHSSQASSEPSRD